MLHPFQYLDNITPTGVLHDLLDKSEGVIRPEALLPKSSATRQFLQFTDATVA
jgi:hypothetical protein